MKDKRSSLSILPMITLFTLLFLCIGLAACGSNQTTGGTTTTGSGSSPSQPTATSPSTGGVQNCGTISVSVRGQVQTTGPLQPQQVSKCFWQAFQQCQPAKLTYHLGGLDTITIRTFTVQKTASGCTAADHVQHEIVPQKPKDLGTFTCTSVLNTDAKLTFNQCGNDGNVVVPVNNNYNPQGAPTA